MARPKEVINEALIEQARTELEGIAEHKVCLRLQAIISCREHPINLVAEIMGTNRTSIWRWIKRFERAGVAGLNDHPKGHRPSKLTAAQKEQVWQWISKSRNSKGEETYWTLEKLAVAIEREFNVKLSTTALWRMVRLSGFRQKVPRPVHAQADYKKNR